MSLESIQLEIMKTLEESGQTFITRMATPDIPAYEIVKLGSVRDPIVLSVGTMMVVTVDEEGSRVFIFSQLPAAKMA